MPSVSTSNVAHRRDALPKYQTTADPLVLGDLLHQPSQDRLVRIGSDALSGRQLSHGMAYTAQAHGAMSDRETHYTLSGQVQVDDAYFGGELSGGKAGRGSENKVPFVAALAFDEAGHPLRVKLTPVSGFTSKAIADWAKTNLAAGCAVLSDGLACFAAVTEAGCQHHAIIIGGRKPKDLPEFLWLNTVLGNLKTSLGGAYHAFDFAKYASRYLAAFAYRFNRRFQLGTLPRRLLVAAIAVGPRPDAWLRSAEAAC